MNNFLELKKQLMLLDPFIRLKRLKEMLVHVKSKQHRAELIEIARITIRQLNQVREGEVRATLDSKLSQPIEDVSEENIERTIEEIAEEESTLTKQEEEQGILAESPSGEKSEGFYGNVESENPGDFYKSDELNVFYEPPEEDKKDKRFYF